MPVLRTAKLTVLSAARGLRLFSAMQHSAWRQSRLLILCYHGISIADEHAWNGEMFMSQEMLRERFALLRDRGYAVLPLGAAVRRLYEGSLPAASVAITFDDGMYNFAARAMPVLGEFGYPATVYVSTFYCHEQRPVFPSACSYVAWKGRGAGQCSAAGLADGEAPLRVDTAADRRASLQRIQAAAADAALSAGEKDLVLREFAARLGVDYERLSSERLFHLMTPAEVGGLAASGVDVQLHTHRHRAPADDALFRRELDDNRRSLAGMSGPAWRAAHFCYPGGSHREGMFPLLRRAGIESATTCLPGVASPADDPLLLPRYIDTAAQPPSAFEAWTSGFAAFLPRRAAA